MRKQTFKGIDHAALEKLIEIKAAFLKREISVGEAKKQIAEHFPAISPLEFAYTEQRLKDMGFSDEKVHENMDELIGLLDGILQKDELSLPQGHPIRTYQEENIKITLLLKEMDILAEKEFDQVVWQGAVEKLYQFNTHLARKQNQLFSKLEEKGFDRPSKIMWSFDNEVKRAISELRDLVKAGDGEAVRKQYQKAKDAILDLIDKEESILYPTSMQLISEQEFAIMRKSDDEIGYCLIENPPAFTVELTNPSREQDFMKEFADLVSRYQLGSGDGVLDMKQGKLTLEQINLIFRHLPIDISFVDENELVQFYSDTEHRIFPRSAGVIGRNVMNCHPRESVHVVKEIIEAFRSGRKNKAEFWISMGDKFIYIIYVAVRNEQGEFKGVLEMMQDVAHIRSLQGQRRLLNWDDTNDAEEKPAADQPVKTEGNHKYGLCGSSIIFDVVKKYPYIREFMPTISPKYEKLLNPVAFNTIGKIATLEMVAQRGNMELNALIEKMTAKIEEMESGQGNKN